MMRQLGGSFGVAVIITFMSRRSMLHRNNLISKIDMTDPAVQNKLLAFQHGLMGKGMDPYTAKQAAAKLIDLSVTKQVAVLSYMDVLLYLGVLFLIFAPIILLAKRKKNNKKVEIEMH
jgi:DHA2 family multidrug resistance protein